MTNQQVGGATECSASLGWEENQYENAVAKDDDTGSERGEKDEYVRYEPRMSIQVEHVVGDLMSPGCDSANTIDDGF